MDDNALYDILREKGMLRGPKRREAVRINTLTAFRGVSSKWCYWLRCTSAKKVPRKIVARILSEESVQISTGADDRQRRLPHISSFRLRD
jgi:hypothetical protein